MPPPPSRAVPWTLPQVLPPARRRRRWVLCLGAAAAAVLLAPLLAAGALAAVWSGARLDTAGEVRFDTPLAVPPLDTGRRDDSGRRVFDLRLQAGAADLGQGRPTPTWGVNGPHLGPTLRVPRGEEVLVHVTNDLDETTTLHWHGMHLPAAMDGGPHQLIAPGTTWSPTWTVDQPAATLWYHPHLHGSTAEHVYRGLAGMVLVDDPDAAVPALPAEYGVDDLPVIVTDRRFTGDGRLDTGSKLVSPNGLIGDTVLVNGTPRAYAEVRTERVRLRLLNASNARVYAFGLDDGRSVDLIGTDGGLLAAPVRTQRVQLSPGERAELVVTMRPGEHAVLRSFPPDLGTDAWTSRFTGGDDTLDVLQLRAADVLRPSPAVPDRLGAAPDLDDADVTAVRTFRLSGMSIDGRRMDPARLDAVVHLGTTEAWEVTNVDGLPHSFHVHDVQFAVAAVDGRPPPPALAGWKDTVYVRPGSTLRLLLRFADYTDPDRPYMYHCHVLMHEDRGMMGQFVVVEPGQRPGLPLRSVGGAAGHPGHG